MSEQCKFERGEPVLVWDDNRFAGVRLFSHHKGGKVMTVVSGQEEAFLSGGEYESCPWPLAERLPKPPRFRNGELVVCKPDHDQMNAVAFFADNGRVTAKLSGSEWPCGAKDIRRPTIEELRNWLPWCEIKPKQGENQ